MPIRAVAYISLCLIWGSTWMAIRVVVRDVPPFRAAGVRFLIAAVVLGLFGLMQQRKLPKSASQWRALAMLSITMMAFPYGLLFWAEQYVSSSLTAVLYSASPLATALMTPLVMGKPVPRAVYASLLVAFGGLAVLFNFELRADANALIGGLLVLVAVVSSSFSVVYAKRETREIDAVVSTAVQLFGGAVVLLGASFGLERGQTADWNAQSIAATLYLAVVGSAVAFAVFYWLLRHMHSYKITTVNLIVPFVAIAVGSVALHERITWQMMASALVVLGAVAVTLRAESEELTEMKLKEG